MQFKRSLDKAQLSFLQDSEDLISYDMGKVIW